MIQKQTVYLPANAKDCNFIVKWYDESYENDVKKEEGYFFTSLEIQDIFTIFARENNISQEKVKIFLNDNFK